MLSLSTPGASHAATGSPYHPPDLRPAACDGLLLLQFERRGQLGRRRGGRVDRGGRRLRRRRRGPARRDHGRGRGGRDRVRARRRLGLGGGRGRARDQRPAHARLRSGARDLSPGCRGRPDPDPRRRGARALRARRRGGPRRDLGRGRAVLGGRALRRPPGGRGERDGHRDAGRRGAVPSIDPGLARRRQLPDGAGRGDLGRGRRGAPARDAHVSAGGRRRHRWRALRRSGSRHAPRPGQRLRPVLRLRRPRDPGGAGQVRVLRAGHDLQLEHGRA